LKQTLSLLLFVSVGIHKIVDTTSGDEDKQYWDTARENKKVVEIIIRASLHHSKTNERFNKPK
jgi:Na+-transporting methylmalonyl-CoA/oxaloacetate decarboxylase gamma subunit